MKMVGGVYLLYLALRAGRSALRPGAAFANVKTGRVTPRYRALYRQGVLMHIGNPKAVLAWMAIMSLGLGETASDGTLPATIGGGPVPRRRPRVRPDEDTGQTSLF